MRNRIKNRIKIITVIVLIIAGVTGFFIAAHFRGYELSIKVEKDTYVYEYLPDSNYGADGYLRVGNYQFGKVQAYYHFNISSLPDGWREANIIVKFDYGSDFVDVGANLTHESWDEITITWNNKPNHSIYRGHILCNGFDFRIPIRSDHIINDGVSVCLYGRGGKDDGYIQGNSREGASSSSDKAYLELRYIGIDPIILTGLSIAGIVVLIVIAVIGVIVAILIVETRSNKIPKIRREPMRRNLFGADWLNGYNVGKSTPTLEKEINQYITLKLIHGRTIIFVDGKRFIQCIRLILNIPKSDVHIYEEVESIDEAAKLYSNHLHQNRIIRGGIGAHLPNQTHNITPEQEFWGHCSNIQAWVEHDYDTRILMSNISFPLLRELVKTGDPVASKVFKEDIALRLESGYPSVVQYLLNQGYLSYFTPSEFKTIIESTELIKGLSSNPRMLSQFLIFCSNKFPTLFEDILIQVLKLPEGRSIIVSSMNIRDIPRMPHLRPSFRSTPQYLLTLKTALENLLKPVDEKTSDDIVDCIHLIENKLKGQEINLPRLPGESRMEAFRKFLHEEGLENLGDEEKLFLAEKFLGEIRMIQSKCSYCGKVIPKGMEICEWCGHKKDDGGGGFFPYPFIFKPPGGGGGGRLKEGAIAIPIRI